jgi:hypothetical protein
VHIKLLCEGIIGVKDVATYYNGGLVDIESGLLGKFYIANPQNIERIVPICTSTFLGDIKYIPHILTKGSVKEQC